MNNDIKEFLSIIQNIKRADYFNASRTYQHHGGKSTVYRHSIRCAYRAYRIGKYFKINKDKLKSTVIAALLHDSYGYDRVANHVGIVSSIKYNNGLEKLTHLHAFYHGKKAVDFTSQYVELNKNQKDAIIKHMFPLYPLPPLHIEGWILTLADKLVATEECIDTAKLFVVNGINPRK